MTGKIALSRDTRMADTVCHISHSSVRIHGWKKLCVEGGRFLFLRWLDLHRFDLSLAEARGPRDVKTYEIEDFAHCQYARAKKKSHETAHLAQ